MAIERIIFLLVEALRQWKCPACGGKGVYQHRGWKPGTNTFINEQVPCKKCEGSGLNPIASRALKETGHDRR